MIFSNKILNWYSTNKRSLPWRTSKDPYKIWLSEIILQQTRIAQGTPYYLKFVEHFPSVFDLAKASEEQVLKLWQGLGYYSRARNLHQTAKIIANEHEGVFPKTYQELLKLKGVGSYTASAIASICYNEPKAVVDGNVYRVLSRFFGVDLPINSSKGIKYFKELAEKVMNVDVIRDYNQGIMEFGALQCVPRNPNCDECPLNESCAALQKNKVDVLPVKLKKLKVKKRYFNYVIPLFRNEEKQITTIIEQRTEKGIWLNLWQFPLIESEKELTLKSLKQRLPEVVSNTHASEVYCFNQEQIVHKLSHQHLYCNFWVVHYNEDYESAILLENVENYPMPILIAKFIEQFKKRIFES